MDSQPPAIMESVTHGGSRRAFALHFLEMVLVMLVGMGVFSGLAAVAFGAADSSLTEQPEPFRVLLMGVNMTVPMVLWMGFRGHSAQRNLEMAAAMMLPTFGAAALVWSGALGVMSGLAVQHVVMVPAMLGVMLWRYGEYAHPHRRQQG